MKQKIIILVALLTFSLSMSAQHFKFMGIPIDGTALSFSNKLKVNKGFKTYRDEYCRDTKTEKCLCGKFANEDVLVFVSSTNKSDKTWHIFVTCFTPYQTRKEAELRFYAYINMIESNYSNSIIGAEVNGDFDVTYYINSVGEIRVQMEKDIDGYYTDISYIDLKNSQIALNEGQGDI